MIGVTATYNSDTGILWLGFSKQIDLTVESFTKIVVNVGSKQINLSEEGQIVAASGFVRGRVIPVLLTEEHQSLLDGTLEDCSVVYGENFSPEYNKLFEKAIIKLYFAPVSYHDFIYYPVYAVEAKSRVNKLWVCNATKLPLPANSSAEPATPVTRQLQLFDPDQDTGIYTNTVFFMKEFGGQVVENDDGSMIVAGVDGDRTGKIFYNPLGDGPRVVYTAPPFNYPNAIDVDSEGMLWVAESSEASRAGRVLRMDLRGNITEAFGEVYTVINSIQCLDDGNLLLGT